MVHDKKKRNLVVGIVLLFVCLFYRDMFVQAKATEVKEESNVLQFSISGNDANEIASCWNEIEKQIKELPAESYYLVEISLEEERLIPKELLDSVQGKNIRVLLRFPEKVILTLYGLELQGREFNDANIAYQEKSPSFSEPMVKKLVAEGNSYQWINLSCEELFAGPYIMNYMFEGSEPGNFVTCYQYNKDENTCYFVSSNKVFSDGSVDFLVENGEQYLMVLSKEQLSEPVDPYIEAPGVSFGSKAFFAALVIAFLGIIFWRGKIDTQK